MPRSFFLLALLTLPLAAGCRMCGSTDDYCVSGFLNRAGDYRGCDPKYRAGSIFYASCGASDMLVQDRSANAGHFGTTTPIAPGYRPEYINSTSPVDNSGTGFESIDQGTPPPSIDEILRDTPVRNLETQPLPLRTPLSPPRRTPAPSLQTPSPDTIETIPFTAPSEDEQPSGEPLTRSVVPALPPEITIEDLRKLDPTVTDIKILNVQDSPGAGVGHLTPRR